jgi:hypothetical protein
VEGVVNALRRIHAALVPGGLLVDTQPVSAEPGVTVAGRAVGALDMREWRATIEAVDAQAARTVDDGLWAGEGEHWFQVTDTFPTGAALLTVVEGWRGTRVPDALRRALGAGVGEAAVHQDVRLRLYRAL